MIAFMLNWGVTLLYFSIAQTQNSYSTVYFKITSKLSKQIIRM